MSPPSASRLPTLVLPAAQRCTQTPKAKPCALGALVLFLVIAGCTKNKPQGDGTGKSTGTAAAAASTSSDKQDPVLRSVALSERLDEALKARGGGYSPRTRHLKPDGSPQFTNRLILESSPYLLQHAHNPVNWFPWGPEALALAKQLNRPIFVSIGYSTCHWCHVMEEESFEDEEVARALNDHYVPIKVDREQRPDIDSTYMTAVQLLTGRGGWPLSVWLTPDLQPFFGGTYFPARSNAARRQPGFLSLLKNRANDFAERGDQVVARAGALTQRIRQTLQASTGGAGIPSAIIERAVNAARTRYDPTNGGRAGAPKFPSSFPNRLLMAYTTTSPPAGGRESHKVGSSAKPPDVSPLAMAKRSLEHMARGGIYDHVGGGFHRYTVDGAWLVPHFEKMLYDNALLTLTYLDGLQLTGSTEFERVITQTLDYVLREMTDPRGGFYSATDADSLEPGGHRAEGYYFTWTPKELEKALGSANAGWFSKAFGVTGAGNFEGRNILHRSNGLATAAKQLGFSQESFMARLDAAANTLRNVRSQRPPPLRDEKIQVSWNGLMIAALARAGLVLQRPDYVKAAAKAADFLLSALRDEAGRLHHSVLGDKRSGLGFVQDYTFLSGGLVELFQATSQLRYLHAATELLNELESYHLDAEAGGYYLTPKDAEVPLVREKPSRDSALPSGNAWALLSQLRIAELTSQPVWQQRADRTLRAFSGQLERSPLSMSEMLRGVALYQSRAQQILIVLPDPAPQTSAPDPAPQPSPTFAAFSAAAEPLTRTVQRQFLPHAVLIVAYAKDLRGELGSALAWTQGKTARNAPTAYLCERGACQMPTTSAEVLAKQIQAL